MSESAIPIFWESSSFLTLQEKERKKERKKEETLAYSAHTVQISGAGLKIIGISLKKIVTALPKIIPLSLRRQSVMYYLYQILSLKFYLMYYLGLRRTTWRPLDAGSTFWIQSVGGKFALSRMYVTFVRAMKKLFWRGIAIEVHARARFSWLATGYLHRYVQVAWIG